ncbi:MFS transporter [Prochlorococcus marinus]|uniref:MFS transporter n=1 Tax=Prochlorococcus marinus XMU1408 TaxID=2213228 RepID=A0A318R376_PROMR|nr:MFS transporter [Prochlorococcus marinus]MBW3042314.1 MFS transporter [Prochlorococcus marinus str. XMU1408]PYE01700.1 MFS transporter [Prochlorococcus marinus XMU1408]
MELVSTSRISNYWERFPLSLRVIIKARLWTAIGAGGVLYLSPVIFNGLGFTAEQIGSGIASAAFAGITTRLGTGYLIDKKYCYRQTIKVACLIAIISDFILFNCQNYFTYLAGQFFLGAAAGIYWPSAEIAVPSNCNNQINTSEGYSLARSADAIGVTLGVSLGTIGTYFEIARIIYFVDIICMLYIFNILMKKLKILKNNEQLMTKINRETDHKKSKKNINIKWIFELFPLLSLTLFVTGVMSLLQSILPLDLANGGIIRPPLLEQRVASLITFKLILIAILQWPVGYILRNKNSTLKFKSCLISLLIGFILLSLSNFLLNGYLLVIIAFIPLTIALCIFLPSASDAIIKSSPDKYQGSAIALYSQCFGISALTIPWMAGRLIDNHETAFQLWLIISLMCILLIPICKRIK